MLAARQALAGELGPAVPDMRALKRLAPGESFDARAVLERREGNLAAVVTGTPAAPVLTATGERQWWAGLVAVVAAAANHASPEAYPHVKVETVAASGASDARARMRTAQAGQVILFLLIIM